MVLGTEANGEKLTKKSGQEAATIGSDVLSGFGADKHPEGSFAVETLPEENFHLGERPEEDQVPVYSKQFLPHL